VLLLFGGGRFVSYRFGIAQIDPKLGDVEANLALYEERIGQARDKGVELLLFPELSLTGYLLRDMVPDVALKLSSRVIQHLRGLSRKVAFVAGLVEESSDYRFYNVAIYFEAGEIRQVHRKVYLPTYGMFDEQRYFARGDRIRAFDTKFGRMAILICEDLWHPSTAFLAALDGALAILSPSASPLRGITEGQLQDDNARYWEMINQSYAETFNLYLIFGNRAGFEDGVGFWGGSEILDPFGQRVSKAKYYEEDLIAGEVAFESVRRKRTMAPILRDEDLDLTINELMRIRGRPVPSQRPDLPASKLGSRKARRRGKKKGSKDKGVKRLRVRGKKRSRGRKKR
jgi:predicted amidohydrolase